jgi:hypothetical protein
MKSPFDRFLPAAPKARSRKGSRKAAELQAELLEKRALMAIDVFARQAGGAIADGWATIVSDGGDNIFAQQVATALPSLLVADNSSFLNAQSVANINAVKDVLVTNGTVVRVTDQESDNYPWMPAPAIPGQPSDRSFFVLPHAADDIDNDNDPVSGEIRNGVGGIWKFVAPAGRGNIWNFVDTNSPKYVQLVDQVPGGSPGPAPKESVIASRGNFGSTFTPISVLELTWSKGGAGLSNESPPEVDISYDRESTGGGFNVETYSDIVASSPKEPQFSLAQGGATGSIIPGSLEGVVFIEQYGVKFEFTTQTQIPVEGLSKVSPLVFRPIDSSGNPVGQFSTGLLFNTTITRGLRQITGAVDFNASGKEFLKFTFKEAGFETTVDEKGNKTGEKLVFGSLTEVGPVSWESGRFARYSQPAVPSDFTLFPGQDFTRSLTVDMLAPGSKIAIESPIVGADFLDLRATSVALDARITSDTRIDVGASKNGQSVAETVSFNSAVAAKTFDIRLADDTRDPRAGAPNKSKLFISPSGSLAGALPAGSATPTTRFDSLFAQVANGDIEVAGSVVGTSQSFIMQSGQEPNPRYPYSFTTGSGLSGGNTGLISGATVAITLGNDAPTPSVDGAIAFNTVDLTTAVDSIRIKASTRQGDATATNPFPYNLAIRERNQISFDAVAASGLPIVLTADGGMTFTSTLETASDLLIKATPTATNPANLLVTAPMSTTKGSINLTGGSITVGNSLQVTGAAEDASRSDIVLTSTNGGIALSGLVSAVNNVSFEQRGAGRIAGAARVKGRNLLIKADGGVGDPTVAQSIATYYLKTDVDSLSGEAANGFAIDEKDDIAITQLRVPAGLVALRANGFDRLNGLNDIALSANLIDVTNLFVSAPNGTVNVQNDSANPLLVGSPFAIQQGAAESMRAAGDVAIRSTAGRIDVTDAPLAGSGARAVRASTLAPLSATYSPGQPGLMPGAISGAGSINGFPGSALIRLSDRVLVRYGVAGNLAANGIYTVTAASEAGWTLTRSLDSDTLDELPNNSVVVDSATGDFYRLTHSMGSATAFGGSTIDVASYDPITNIGTDLTNPENVVTFIVSSSSGTTLGAGSLGKMISLRQQNEPIDESQPMGFKFSSLVTQPIVLTQELPALRKAFSIDAAPQGRFIPPGASASAGRIVVNGQSITETNRGEQLFRGTTSATVTKNTSANPNAQRTVTLSSSFKNVRDLRDGMVVSGIGVRPGTRIAAGGIDVSNPSAVRVTLTDAVSPNFGRRSSLSISVTFSTELTGFRFLEDAAGGGVANLNVGGFETGNAVKVEVPNVTLTNLTVGQGNAGNRLGNEIGVLVAAGSAAINGGTITSSTVAGIRTSQAAAVTISGVTIGTAALPNVIGIEIGGGGGASIGVATDLRDRNVVQFNRTGIVLRAGGNTVTNTTVVSNTFDGISIEGGSNSIGISKARAQVSNAIYASGRWGVSIVGAVARAQKVVGNFLGSGLFGSMPGKNIKGNIVIDGKPPVGSFGLTPDKTGVDKSGNQHSDGTSNPKPRVNRPWRARR